MTKLLFIKILTNRIKRKIEKLSTSTSSSIQILLLNSLFIRKNHDPEHKNKKTGEAFWNSDRHK